MPSESVQSKLPGLEARIAELHRQIDRLITEHVCDIAEDISGCPTTTVRSLLVSRPQSIIADARRSRLSPRAASNLIPDRSNPKGPAAPAGLFISRKGKIQ
jgi:hypothetical protein